MEISAALDFVRSNNHAVLATVRRDGRPAMSPITVAVDAEDRVVISTRETAYKVRHVTADPNVTLCVFTQGFYGSWVQLEGTASLQSLPEAMDGLVDYYRRASGGEHPDWDEYRQAMRDEQRCLMRITVTRAGPDRQG